MKKVVTKAALKSPSGDLGYWLACSIEERFAALETLRQQAHLSNAEQRLQRVHKVTQLKKR